MRIMNPPLISLGKFAASLKNTNDTRTASGIFRLFNTDSVPASTLRAPKFHRKKQIPEAITPRYIIANNSFCDKLNPE